MQLDTSYVKKKKAKKVVIAVASAALVLLLILSLIAILTKQAGAFTVALQQGSTNLTMSLHESFDTTTTYMSTGKLPCYNEYTYEAFANDVIGEIDSETYNTPKPNGSNETISFFKYTFYVKNMGVTSADYNITLSLTSVGASTTNKAGLDSVLRVKVYENRDLTQHDYKVYALRSNVNREIDETTGAYVYSPERISKPDGDFAIPFVSSKTVLSNDIIDFQPEEICRYTFVIWVEGEDPDCTQTPPNNTLKLSVGINAHEHVEVESGNEAKK